jgi:hypothetical protein
MPTIRAFPVAMRDYEHWLRQAIPLRRDDLDRKHAAMAEASFPFFRATFFRWAETFAQDCPALAQQPTVLAVGDLHVENFGAWRDGDGRLSWGVNDFDETYRLPFTNDLVRLAVSCVLAGTAVKRTPDIRDVAESVLDGYRSALALGGRPFVLTGEHQWLRKAALSKLKDPAVFWAKLDGFGPATAAERARYAPAARAALPSPHSDVRLIHRVAGMGSLGRPRVVALATWQGGPVAREAKALVASACDWVRGRPADSPTHIARVLNKAVRSPDPTLHVTEHAIVRRLAPDGSRVEFADLNHPAEDERLMRAMGWETANVHLGTGRAATLLGAERELPRRWLVDAVEVMLARTRRDRREFCA